MHGENTTRTYLTLLLYSSDLDSDLHHATSTPYRVSDVTWFVRKVYQVGEVGEETGGRLISPTSRQAHALVGSAFSIKIGRSTLDEWGRWKVSFFVVSKLGMEWDGMG